MAVFYFAYIFIFGGLNSEEKKRVLVIAILFFFAAIFWAAFEQAPTSLNLFAQTLLIEQYRLGNSCDLVSVSQLDLHNFAGACICGAYGWRWEGARKIHQAPQSFHSDCCSPGLGFAIMIPLRIWSLRVAAH